ncbi:MAG TPA: metal-dependent hydrolase [Thermoanaerobaculia bacterium]|nr:metal-dependent hydrolase [Thermoanaerobaculia bacterium]
MFIGHEAVGFAGKRGAPRMSLGTLMLAATWLDLVWPVFLILGIEHVRIRGGPNPFLILDFYDYPWTHSLIMAIAWSVGFAVVYWLVTRYGRGALIAGVLVFSHWALDFVTHIPDLPLVPGGEGVGLGLWRIPAATIAVEILLFAAGLWIYVRATKARDRIGSIAFVVFVIFLLLVYAANLTSPPPPNANAIGWAALAGWLLPLWAWWFDRHRDPRT